MLGLIHKGISKLIDALTKPLLQKARTAEEPKGLKTFDAVAGTAVQTAPAQR